MPTVKSATKLKNVPKFLLISLYIFGINLQNSNGPSLDLQSKRQIISEKISRLWLKFAFFLPHGYLALYLWWGLFGSESMSFFAASLIDTVVYMITYDMLYSRRESVKNVLMRLQQLPNQGKKRSQRNRYLSVQILLWISVIFSASYFIYSFTIFDHSEDELIESEETSVKYIGIILKVFMWLMFNIFLYNGLSIYVCLFVHFCMLVDEKLQMINRSLDAMLKRRMYCLEDLRKQRRIFCTLQQITSEANDIFADIVFLWIGRIVARSAGGAYHFSTSPWTGEGIIIQILLILDTVYDIASLVIMCFYAGRMVKSKSEILEPLTGLCGLNNVQLENCTDDIHFFLGIVGYSSMAMTVWNISPLNMNLAATVLGGIGSNAVIIFQLSST
ncbi:uncharacterized protein TNIN_491351 [Trichonephila inaurata madagascariensis]|uniref:Gustatory receptor n=1 Tax=Trichonephila inaurata madagascariensis TaxID=2747483 RepID=A0A8X7CHM4_9ARAC|nr:uncharacterized protein TNIN_491351 [Trichonephila inaurata madagascariensis]